MSATAEATKTTLVAPYGAWKTMENAFDRFANGVPPRVDRTGFPGLEWNAITRLLGGLRFLGLIDDIGNPQPMLNTVTTGDENARKYALARVIRERYAELFKLDLARVTPGHLEEVLGATYNVKGDTLEKAMRFFVAASTYVGVELSPLVLSRASGRRSGPSARRTPAAPKPPRNTMVPPLVPTGQTRTVNLMSGGVVTLTAAVDFLTLSAADREFVFELIDKLSAYEREPPIGD